MPQHDPAVDLERASDEFEVRNGLRHRMSAATGPADSAWLRAPRAHSFRNQLVVSKIVNASRAAGENQNVRPCPTDIDVKTYAVRVDHVPGFHEGKA